MTWTFGFELLELSYPEGTVIVFELAAVLSVERRGGSTAGAETEIDGWERLREWPDEFTEEVEPERE